MSDRDGCWSCGALGRCFSGCKCLKCLNPIRYHSYVRNLPGDWQAKSEADRRNRLVLEANGQQTFAQAIHDANKMFSALQNKLPLILLQAQEKFKAAKDALSLRHMLADFLRELGSVAGDLMELTKGEQWL